MLSKNEVVVKSKTKERKKMTKEQLTEKDVELAVKQLAYRKEYNKRPEVVEKRKLYNKQRNERIKLAIQLLKEREGGSK